jgi:leader peptidase (prepilin peptidase)/N-methyltransferase
MSLFTVQSLLIVSSLAMGAAWGSFINCVMSRTSRKIRWWGKERSECPSCGVQIRWHDNVPLSGFIMLRGKCRECKTQIPARYLLAEVCGAVVAVALMACFLSAMD